MLTWLVLLHDNKIDFCLTCLTKRVRRIHYNWCHLGLQKWNSETLKWQRKCEQSSVSSARNESTEVALFTGFSSWQPIARIFKPLARTEWTSKLQHVHQCNIASVTHMRIKSTACATSPSPSYEGLPNYDSWAKSHLLYGPEAKNSFYVFKIF